MARKHHKPEEMVAKLRQVEVLTDAATEQDYSEPPGPRVAGSYVREQHDIVEPLRALFDIVREVATAITHEVGAFG